MDFEFIGLIGRFLCRCRLWGAGGELIGMSLAVGSFQGHRPVIRP